MDPTEAVGHYLRKLLEEENSRFAPADGVHIMAASCRSRGWRFRDEQLGDVQYVRGFVGPMDSVKPVEQKKLCASRCLLGYSSDFAARSGMTV